MRKLLRLALFFLLLSLLDARAATFEKGFVTTAEGIQLFYEKGGTGARTVIIPGRLFLLEDFRWLAERYTVIAYDMRNRGRSSFVQDGSRLTFEADLEDLEAVRRHFGVSRASLMGYSYLGKIVALYAMQHPERVERVIQFGPVPLRFGTTYAPRFVASDDARDPEQRARLRKLREDGFHLAQPQDYCEEEWKVSRQGLVGDPSRVSVLRGSKCDMPNEWPTNLVRHMHHHFFGSGQKHEVPRERVAAMSTPVLTIHGTRDRNAPYGAGREWSFLLPQGRLLTLEGGAHQAFAEFPDVVMPAVREFLDGRWPVGAVKVSEDPRTP